jgi:hypothetical protein
MVKLFMASSHNWLCKLRLNLDRKVPPCMSQIYCHSGSVVELESSCFFCCLCLWPAATNVVALRPHPIYQTSFELRSQGSTLHGPKGDQQQSPLGSPLPFRQHFRFLTKQQQRKNCDGN